MKTASVSFIRLNAGVKFGRLKVLKTFSLKGKGRAECVCDCGKTIVTRTYLLRKGRTQSCGCLRDELRRSLNTTHGHSRVGKMTTEYSIWESMIKRCSNKNHERYSSYGGRGIKVCPEWRDFSVFFSDMGSRPSGHSLDRINNNDGYNPNNCRWATVDEQARNKRNNFNVTFDGDTLCITDMAKKVGIKLQTLHKRIRKLGWSIERACSHPPRKMKRA